MDQVQHTQKDKALPAQTDSGTEEVPSGPDMGPGPVCTAERNVYRRFMTANVAAKTGQTEIYRCSLPARNEDCT